MTQINYYDDVKILKKPLKQRIKSIFNFFLIIVVVIGCFYGAMYLSSALTVGNIANIIVYGGTSVKIDKSNLYAVTMGVYDSYSEAEKVALGSSIQGASGYIWQDSDRYYVIGNIYYTKDECNKVIENLSNTNYKVDVLNIEFPKLKLNFDMYENSDMAVVNDAMNIFDDVYDDIYSNSIKFDKGEISHLAVSSNVSQIRGKLKNIIISTQGLINNKSSDLNIVQGYLVELDEVLNQTILKTIDNTSTGYSLKYAIANVVRLKFDMFNKLC